MSRGIRLSRRLEAVVSLVKPGGRVADVGTDHGYVPVALTERKIASSVVAMDVREGPLRRAQDHVRQRGLENRISLRLSDGVEKLEAGEADTVIAAGMGGELIIHILGEGQRLWETVGHWILSPQSEPEKVRYYLNSHGFRIDREVMVEEDGKYYVVMDAVRGDSEPLDREQALYGPRLLEDPSPVFWQFLLREEAAYRRILKGLAEQTGHRAAVRKAEIEERLVGLGRILAARETEEERSKEDLD